MADLMVEACHGTCTLQGLAQALFDVLARARLRKLVHHRRLILVHDVRDGDVVLPVLFHREGVVHGLFLGHVVRHHDDLARPNVHIALAHIRLGKSRR